MCTLLKVGNNSPNNYMALSCLLTAQNDQLQAKSQIELYYIFQTKLTLKVCNEFLN